MKTYKVTFSAQSDGYYSEKIVSAKNEKEAIKAARKIANVRRVEVKVEMLA